MNSIAIDYRTTDGKSPTNVRLLRNPLDFIAEDHLRLRTMCAEMEKWADAPKAEPEAVSEIRTYLTDELPRLLSDEDDDLMPCLLARAEAEDEVPKLADRLRKEHAEIEKGLAAAQNGLDQLLKDGADIASVAADLRHLANVARRHLFLENAVLLPLARARLTDDDLRAMRANMRARRDLDPTIDQ